MAVIGNSKLPVCPWSARTAFCPY